MTKVVVDADACPVMREAIAAARARQIEVVVVGNESQNLGRLSGQSGVTVVQVASGPDAADFAIIPLLTTEDVVVTADIGLAAMVLGKGARALSPRGHRYTPATIDSELAVRYAEQKHRRAGKRTQGPPPFRDEDRDRFRRTLEDMLSGRVV
jgi:hypothetical protein